MSSRGFTLVEILIVMLITSVLVLGIHAAYRQAHALWSQAEDDRGAYYMARVLTEALREELSGLYMPPMNLDGEEAGSDRAFRLTAGSDGARELSFLTLTPAWRSDITSSRPARVSYRFGKDQDTGRTVLRRVEVLCAGEKPVGQEVSDVLVENLMEFGVWVFPSNDGVSVDSWQQAYESDDQPPTAARILLKWNSPNRHDPRARPIEFVSVVFIPCEGLLIPAGV